MSRNQLAHWCSSSWRQCPPSGEDENARTAWPKGLLAIGFLLHSLAFDFVGHRRSAEEQFASRRGIYVDFAAVVKDILTKALADRGVKIHSIEARAKSIESFGRKASSPSELDSGKPKYERPLEQIDDLAGVRVITFLTRAVSEACKCIEEEFAVVERVDRAETLLQQEKFGYQSIHYVARLNEDRAGLAEYRRFKGLKVEIQVRTILQHAWAEIEHDIGYKSSIVIPNEIRRRFSALGGMLEIADREFESIQEQDSVIRAQALSLVEEGNLGSVEITPYTLKAYLDKRLGADDRVSDYSYQYAAKTLRQIGFSDLGQVDKCISGFDDDKLSRIASGWRQGQLSRFDFLLLAGMGEFFVGYYAKGDLSYYVAYLTDILKKFKEASVEIRSYVPDH